MKKCTKCGKKYSTNSEYFGKDKGTKDGLACWCKKCRSKQKKKYYRTEKGRQYQKKYKQSEKYKVIERRANLKKNYNITLEQYDQMFAVQDGICAICGKPETVKNQYGVKRLSIDHNHETGEFRGLLCSSCNFLIGNAKESLLILKSAINYLKNR